MKGPLSVSACAEDAEFEGALVKGGVVYRADAGVRRESAELPPDLVGLQVQGKNVRVLTVLTDQDEEWAAQQG
eukprot:9949087-Alexandrium_andersonii.AAC.1